ncbi:MAG: hypothetical protein GY710_05005 [Desulfobacteraceae bacterium]|nr:hypothetical protein [Desulfobacteraceae bacterium]
MRQFILYIVFGIVVFFPPTVNADFYKFRDQNDTIIFTDDLSKVPEEQRSGIKTYQSDKSPLPPPRKENMVQPILKKDVAEKQKEWLINEQNQLTQEKKKLLLLKNTANTPEKKEIYNINAEILNKKIKLYKKKLADFKNIVD